MYHFATTLVWMKRVQMRTVYLLHTYSLLSSYTVRWLRFETKTGPRIHHVVKQDIQYIFDILLMNELRTNRFIFSIR